MVHSSFRAVRPVDSGPEGLLEALLEAVGPGGTVMAYVSWDRSPYDGDNPRELSPDERRGWPAFDPATASAYPDWGVLLEVLCRHPCAVRSANPDNSFAAVGAQAKFLMADHSLDYGMGARSPLAKLCHRGGKVALLGAPLDAITLVHHADYLADLPNKTDRSLPSADTRKRSQGMAQCRGVRLERHRRCRAQDADHLRRDGGTRLRRGRPPFDRIGWKRALILIRRQRSAGFRRPRTRTPFWEPIPRVRPLAPAVGSGGVGLR